MNKRKSEETQTTRRTRTKKVIKKQKYKLQSTRIKAENNYIGDIAVAIITTAQDKIPINWTTCFAEIEEREDTSILHLVFDSEVKLFFDILEDVVFLKDLFLSKVFLFEFEYVDASTLMMKLSLHDLNVTPSTEKVTEIIKLVFKLLYSVYDVHFDEGFGSTDFNVSSFYEKIRETRGRQPLPESRLEINTFHLKPTLPAYQQEAIQWMMHRENIVHSMPQSHPLYEEVDLACGKKVFYNKHNAIIRSNRIMAPPLGTGGILCDEMGLGKTVEILACILSHSHYGHSNSGEECASDSDLPLSDFLCSPSIVKQKKRHKVLKVRNARNETAKHRKRFDATTNVMRDVRNDFVKKTNQPSLTRQLLNDWYRVRLEGEDLKLGLNRNKTLSCVCGMNEESDGDNVTVQCVECGVFQHAGCMDYKKIYGNYFCPTCWKDKPLLEARGTVIVTPNSLKEQWVEEIFKHVRGKVKVFIYEGSSTHKPVYPVHLLKYDIILTTYNVLQSDLRLTENKGKSLRAKQRYSVPGCPISRVKWWRLVLDEAQLVESPHQMISEMAKRITATHRWAVTGTPISKGISDLYGLLDYLQFNPYAEFDTWTHLLYRPYMLGAEWPMLRLLGDIMWRTEKIHVTSQINIPKQEIIEHWIEFNAVETFFYDREHELSSALFLDKLVKLELHVELTLQSIPPQLLKNILAPLLTLRRACAHHSAVKGRYLLTKKPMNSIDGLLEALIDKNVSDSEEYLRIVISSLNGLAGVLLLLENIPEAIEQYVKVLEVAKRFKAIELTTYEMPKDGETTECQLAVDKLLLIHTLYNMESIAIHHPNFVPAITVYVGNLEGITRKREEIESAYIEKFVQQAMAILMICNMRLDKMAVCRQTFRSTSSNWYTEMVHWIMINNYFEELVTRINKMDGCGKIKYRYSNHVHLLFQLGNWEKELNECRTEMVEEITALYEIRNNQVCIENELVQAARDCHLRPREDKNAAKIVCRMCNVNVILKKYERILFNMIEKKCDVDMSNKGDWKPSFEENVFKALLSTVRGKTSHDLIMNQDGILHCRLLLEQKKEFKDFRKLWTCLHELVNAIDEIEMCKIRLSVRDEDVTVAEATAVQQQAAVDPNRALTRLLRNLATPTVDNLQHMHMLSRYELNYQQQHLVVEAQATLNQLLKNVGTFKYLRTLRVKHVDGGKPDPCPICQNELVDSWNILTCGHCYCVNCMQMMAGDAVRDIIVCAVCRGKFNVKDINYFEISKPKSEYEYEVKGNCSTKVEAIIRLVIDLRKEDSDVKILIYSSWVTVLNILQQSFIENGINSIILGSGNMQKKIDSFKNVSKGITALLLPFSLGSKGLNLTIATRVILIDPVLDPSDELQAIGRVHRIGQDRPTVVHKFLTMNSIDENIHYATKNAQNWASNKVTVQQIKELFTPKVTNSS